MLTSPLLKVKGLVTGYGQTQVLHRVEMEVAEGEIVTVLGANGAGKTTVLRAISGLLKPWEGEVELAGQPITGRRAEDIARLGAVMVPEGRGIFPDLSVLENLKLGAWTRRRDRKAVLDALEVVFGYFPVLRERESQPAGSLSGGEQQMLAIGRALASRPRLVMLDEASLGLSPALVKTLFSLVSAISRAGVTILMVEQNASALALAARAYVLQKGRVVYQGPASELAKAPDEVRQAYLGATA